MCRACACARVVQDKDLPQAMPIRGACEKFHKRYLLLAVACFDGGCAVVQQRKAAPGQAAETSKYLGIGLTWALSTALFLYLGSLADARLGTAPWLTLIGAFVGAAAGFYYMYHHLVVAPRERSEREGKRGR